MFIYLHSKGIYLYCTFTVVAVDNTIKLIGAGAFAFHPTLEWIFVGDRRGTLLAWDVSTERPSMIGMWVVYGFGVFIEGNILFNLVLNCSLALVGDKGKQQKKLYLTNGQAGILPATSD